MNFLKRLWPKNLVGQTILLLVFALFSAQIIGALIFRGEARDFYEGARARFLAERISPTIDLLRTSPPKLQEEIVAAMGSRWINMWLGAPVIMSRSDDDDDDELASLIASQLKDTNPRRVHVAHRDHDDHDDHEERHKMLQRRLIPMAHQHAARQARTIISAEISDGRWLNITVKERRESRLIHPQTWITFFVAVVVISIIVFFVLRRITSPLAELSRAAGKLGRGENIPPLIEEGPADIRETTRAFNDMRERLGTFVSERTRMLAAISHDLRTPITALRLRAEMIEDEENREKIISLLNEMLEMTEASLTFAKIGAKEESTRRTDLSALIQAVTDDLTDIGRDVTYSSDTSLTYRCRPSALKRALSNLIENAAVYGERARVSLKRDTGNIIICIEDDGPGIAETDRARVFEPFQRLETSRNAGTGGVGLGMAIARDIVRHHGGDIDLQNGENGGLVVTVTLPEVSDE